MNDIFNKYDYIILDFSAMFFELPNDLVDTLNALNRVFVAPTFECECTQVQEVVPNRVATCYKKNKSNIIISSKMVYRICGTIDTFGLVKSLCNNFSVLVIEANYSLEDRIVLSAISADVYSLLENRIIRCNEYTQEVKSRTISKAKTPLSYHKVKSGDVIYTKNSEYSLLNIVEGGAEAQIFSVREDAKILAKIYKEDMDGNFILTSQKLKNINMLREVNICWDVVWLALPLDIIYADPSRREPIGYTMKYFGEIDFLSNNSLFIGGDIRRKFPKYDETTIKDVLDICIKFVRQILFLSLNDIYISDYNDKNFGIPIKDNNKIIMVDTDSYCCEGYVSECMTYSGYFSKEYKCNTRIDLINICCESLFTFIFTRLTLDDSFFPMRKSEFRFSERNMVNLSNPNFKAKWNSIPKNLQKLFINIFDNKKSPSMDILLYELVVAQKKQFSNRKYKDIYREVFKTTGAQSISQSSTILLSPLRRNRARVYVVGISVFSLIICWFVFSYPSMMTTKEVFSSKLTELIQNHFLQLQRYEMKDGYYLSYTSKPYGYLEIYWNDGDSYKGNCRDGVPNGYGEYKSADGDLYKGNFKDGKLTGSGTYNYSDGTKYIGSFQNGDRNGQGILYDTSNNKVYEGGWKSDCFSGEGIYYFPNSVSFYDDTWENGTCRGGESVTLSLVNNGQIIAKGYWYANVFHGCYYKDKQWYDLP